MVSVKLADVDTEGNGDVFRLLSPDLGENGLTDRIRTTRHHLGPLHCETVREKLVPDPCDFKIVVRRDAQWHPQESSQHAPSQVGPKQERMNHGRPLSADQPPEPHEHTSVELASAPQPDAPPPPVASLSPIAAAAPYRQDRALKPFAIDLRRQFEAVHLGPSPAHPV